MAQRFPSVVPVVNELAEHFLPKGTEEELSDLAGCIQEEIENWLQEHQP